MRWRPRSGRAGRMLVLFPRPFRRDHLTLVQDEAVPPAPGLSTAYGCRTLGCTHGTCARCSELRQWGARSACRGCGAPLEQPPQVFVGGRPVCGQCATRTW
jgi:hypothetical protein